MGCQFQIPWNGDPTDWVRKAGELIGKAGGVFSGDAVSGNFTSPTPVGKISGTYQVQDGQMTLNITEKPVLLPCSLIEQYLSKYLAGT
ncbi:MAG TPA: hypothetical protein VMV20_06335 [Chitinophagaceae bacterium]|nr:hypothetical protein [Chitinophagaceae bacterium]